MRSVNFRFEGMRSNGVVEVGEIDASDRQSALSLLIARGVFPTEIKERHPRSRSMRISAQDLALGLRTLATLLKSGLPLARALVVLQDMVAAAWASALPAVSQRIEHGQQLALALKTSGLPLPPHVIGIIEAGEAGSDLAEAVERAALVLETRAANRAAVRNALAYPLMLALAGGATVILLVGHVLPRFVLLLNDTGQQLPVLTRIVLAAATIAERAVVPGGAMLVIAVLIIVRWSAGSDGRAALHMMLLRLPYIGQLRLAAATASMCSSLAALLRSGMPLALALPHAATACGDEAVGRALLRVRQRLLAGESFSAALKLDGLVTPALIRLVRAGEETADLGNMLEYSARIEADQTLQRLHRLIRFIEPAMILVFGGVVGLIAAALLQAMYAIRPV